MKKQKSDIPIARKDTIIKAIIATALTNARLVSMSAQSNEFGVLIDNEVKRKDLIAHNMRIIAELSELLNI